MVLVYAINQHEADEMVLPDSEWAESEGFDEHAIPLKITYKYERAKKIQSVQQVPDGFDLDGCPWGERTDKTVRELLHEQRSLHLIRSIK